MLDTVLCVLRHIEEQNEEILSLLRTGEGGTTTNNVAAKEILTVKDAARLLKVSKGAILGWIGFRQLRAINVGRGTNQPRWRIARADLDVFFEGRSTQPRPARTRRQRPKFPENYIRYYPEH